MPYVMPVIWLSAFIILIVVECITQGLTTIWFAGGAVIALFVAAVDGPIWLQLLAFVLISVIMLIFTRPALAKLMNGHLIKTNVETAVGQFVMVKEKIDNMAGTGVVILNGLEWSARSVNDAVIIEAGEKVKVTEVSGVKLIVDTIL